MTASYPASSIIYGDDVRWNNVYGDDDAKYLGRPTLITYSFPETKPSDFGIAVGGSFAAFNDEWKAAARAQLAKFEAVAGLKFVEVSGSSGQIRFGIDLDVNASWAGLGALPYSYHAESGDLTRILKTTTAPTSVTELDKHVMRHEIGHTLGLQHTHEGTILESSLDNVGNTVMSYNYLNGEPSTELGSIDIEALQYLYGLPFDSRKVIQNAALKTIEDIRANGNQVLGTALSEEFIVDGSGDFTGVTIDGSSGYDFLDLRDQGTSTTSGSLYFSLRSENESVFVDKLYNDFSGNAVTYTSNFMELRNIEYVRFSDIGTVAVSDYFREIPDDAVSRFFSLSTGSHFYTASAAEKQSLLDSSDTLMYEGATFAAADATLDSVSAVHRFYNTQTGTHFYTMSESEKTNVEETLPQFVYEGTAYSAYATEADGSKGLHRFFNTDNGVHFYTPSEEEKAYVEQNLAQFNYEGIAYWVDSVA